ncbi:LysR family transcriptional regulator [Brevibacillus sp. SYSU BS000544]|uniref:LysR family transcriptional regulator n=1 Tax=Brevibacillus sp. SYSU BS000544 TaxID=3416443 RepID=UPI003CE4DBBE
MDVNLEWYRVFYWTAKLGSLSRAAERLHISQPAVSQTIKLLETKLEGQLFFRTSKGVTLTVEGEVLFRYVEQAFSFVEIGEKKIAEMHNLLSGEINIGASDTLCKHYLLPYLEMFHKQFPKVRIRITNRTTPETISLLKEGKIDFGIVSLPIVDKQIAIRQSLPLEDCLVGGKAFAGLVDLPLPLEKLNDFPLLVLEKGSNSRDFLDEFTSQNKIQLNPEFELGSIDLLAQFARSGFGLAFVIRDSVANDLASGELFEIPLDIPLPTRHIGIATLRGVPLSAATKSFLALLP